MVTFSILDSTRNRPTLQMQRERATAVHVWKPNKT